MLEIWMLEGLMLEVMACDDGVRGDRDGVQVRSLMDMMMMMMWHVMDMMHGMHQQHHSHLHTHASVLDTPASIMLDAGQSAIHRDSDRCVA